jgi:hypothetical protein
VFPNRRERRPRPTISEAERDSTPIVTGNLPRAAKQRQCRIQTTKRLTTGAQPRSPEIGMLWLPRTLLE